MTRVRLLFTCLLALFSTSFAWAQSLQGHWVGKLPQNNKSYDFIMEMDIEQNGDSLSGTSKLTSPIDKAYVLLRFKGRVSTGNKMDVKEYEVLSSTRTGRLDWCIKRLRGQLSLDQKRAKMIIKGTWSSHQLYSDGRYYRGGCSPGRFELEKKLPPKKKPVIPEKKPEVVKKDFLFSGFIYDKKSTKGIPASLGVAGGGQRMKVLSGAAGAYRVKVGEEGAYDVHITAEGYHPLDEKIVVQGAELRQDFFMVPIEKEKPLLEEERTPAFILNTKTTLKNVLFKKSTAEILPESYPELGHLLEHLKKHPKLQVMIEGHTDRIGSYKKNMILSQQRAQAIKAYLTEKGIKARRIDTEGYGHNQTICPPPCKENRRVVFILSKK